MRKILILFISCILSNTISAQSEQSWGDYYSYYNISKISSSINSVVAATENAIFSKHISTNKLVKKNTLDGLSGQTITALYYSESAKKTFIGYQNGLITIINESDGKIRHYVDVINKVLQTNYKTINNFYQYENYIYVSTDFGIVQFNLQTLEFGDTYFIGNNGAEINIRQITIFGGYIYAATQQNGIRRAEINNPNLIHFNQWTEVNSGWIADIASTNGNLVFGDFQGNLHKFNGVGFQLFHSLNSEILDIKGFQNRLISCSKDKIVAFDDQLNVMFSISNMELEEDEVEFTCVTIIQDKIYAGTKQHGVIIFPINNVRNYSYYAPDGPERNSVFSVNAQSDNLWITFGGFSSNYNPYEYLNIGLTNYGISKYANNKWDNIPFSKLLYTRSLSRILLHPTDVNAIYVASFIDGLLKVENNVGTQLYSVSNTGTNGFQTMDSPRIDVRVLGMSFDKTGNLWTTNSGVEKPVIVMRANNRWDSYSVSNVIDAPRSNYYNDVVIDRSDVKWYASYKGLVAFDEKTNVMKLINSNESEGNLPSDDVRALAIDNRNRLWIGTNRGLRVLSSVDRFRSDATLKTNPIIIMEEGLAQELLYQQFITDIVVDGANNKWIGTADAGVFHVSSDGQKILHQFNINNSPLPSNSINDIDINPNTGEVFFATPKGLISYKGISTKGSDDLNNVVVYPNPVRPGYTGTVKITGLLDKANVKITDIQGNLVHEAITEGGTIEWDTTAFGKYKVATGVYMIFISSEDAMETKVKKVMIVR